MSRYNDLAETVTTKLIDQIRSGVGEWTLPWHQTGAANVLAPTNITTGKRYAGANIWILALDALERGFPTGDYATYRQLATVGYQVRKGETGAQIIKWVPRKNDNIEGDSERRLIPKVYTVFNRAQVDATSNAEPLPEPEPMQHTTLASYITDIGATVVYGGDDAFYERINDVIHLPELAQFDNEPSFWVTSLHEHIHFTGHHTRLNRLDDVRRSNMDAYAFEELIAETGAAMAAARFGLAVEPRPDHAAYLDHYLQILDADPTLLFKAAAKASAAMTWLDTQAETAAPAVNVGLVAA